MSGERVYLVSSCGVPQFEVGATRLFFRAVHNLVLDGVLLHTYRRPLKPVY